MKDKKIITVLFMVPSPVGISPGQRFRFEHYLTFLKQEGIQYKISPFLSMWGRTVLYSRGHVFQKVFAMIGGLIRRSTDLFRVWKYEYVYIHRWASTAGPPIAEWVIAKVFRKKIIYDFDDSIWVKESPYNKNYLNVKFLGKISKICRWAHVVTVGNSFLAEYAKKYNKNVIILPTVVNTDTIHGEIQCQETDKPAIGWTGTFSTLKYIDIVLPALRRIQEKSDFIFYVIADKDPELQLKNYRFVKWCKETETQDLLRFHIGLMPLTEDEITKGKCGFKAIQYMALGMPALVSPVGVNADIVEDGKNGFICKNSSEWEEKMLLLLQNSSLRKEFGIAARKKIENSYSVSSTRNVFIGLFRCFFIGFITC